MHVIALRAAGLLHAGCSDSLRDEAAAAKSGLHYSTACCWRWRTNNLRKQRTGAAGPAEYFVKAHLDTP